MKVIYTGSIDSVCAASMVRNMCSDPFDKPEMKDFIQDTAILNMNAESQFDWMDLGINEKVFIVGLDDSRINHQKMIECIKYCCIHGSSVKIVCKDPITLSSDISSNHIMLFTEPELSASALVYAYSCMNPDERMNPNNVDFGTTDDMSTLQIGATEDNRMYYVPLAVRFATALVHVEDNADQDKESKEYNEIMNFGRGVSCLDDAMHPWGDDWVQLFNNEYRTMKSVLDNGGVVKKYLNTHIRFS